ncbi:MAG: glycosyl hydrolase family 95 catalytic domain-containing protein [Lachnospiraceae bacterium]
MKNLRLRQNTPANRWGEAYPLGNGHMGAMVFGSFPNEEIIFSENTFYSGERSRNHNQPHAAEAFERMRLASLQGDHKKVKEEADSFIGVRENYGTNLPVGKMKIRYLKQNSDSKVTRNLNLRTGIVTNKRSGLVEKMFTSSPDRLFAMEIKSEESQDYSITWESMNHTGTHYSEGNKITLKEYAYETMHCDKNCGTMLDGLIVVSSDGELEAVDGNMFVRNAKCSTIRVFFATDFIYDEKNANQQLEYEAGQLAVKQQYERTSGFSFKELKERHKRDFVPLMEKTLLQFEQKSEETYLLETSFAYGKYLLLSSSRKDSILPAHLQGIWNDSVACNIGWTCDMHLDINTQMNYWISGAMGMLDSQRPLYRWMEKSLIPNGRECAKLSYGRPGWVAELVSNAWGFAAPYWASPIAPCPTGGLWLFMQYWEEYLYTGEKTFLKEEVFPLLEEMVRFFTAYVYQREDGIYTSGPSISPENSFLWEGETFQISMGCTYEIIMIRELFQIYLKAAEELSDSEVSDPAMIKAVAGILPKLLPYRIREDGTLAEYDTDFIIPDRQHRHTSHLLGLFPFAQITPDKTPELAEAIEHTLIQKLTPKENWEDTGWARSLLLLYEARLWNGEKAYAHVQDMLSKLREPNGMIYHPPTRGAGAFDHVYELDGNTGLTMGLTEMLVQGHDEMVRFLPAIPRSFPDGRLVVYVKGGLKADVSWKDQKVRELSIWSGRKQSRKLFFNGEEQQVQLLPGWTKIRVIQSGS